jgi:hypothetical protein
VQHDDLELPPIGGVGGSIGAAAVAALATLYLQAELEQAGVIPAAETLVEARVSLPIPTVDAAQKLERFAQRQRNWYDRQSRNLLFARLFGIGPAATNAASDAVNHAFEQLLAALCASIDRAAADLRPGLPPSAEREAQVRLAANNLLENLGLRQYGNTVFAARRIQDELEAAIELLKDPDVEAVLHTQGFWPTVRRVLEPDVPDLYRLVDRGQSGQHLLSWLAGAGSAVGDLSRPLLTADSPAYGWAASWLGASGLTGSDTAVRRAA